ncbi:MAG: response regulator transcription factor [Sterolibacteriaceae bacterium]|jgi:DNA-binding NarL/FixJ family response regulator|nr:response regulator transcription factor [Sterolibacteriaceae bacterium]MBK9084760.1 response regulator transcription factor [Sterolibacteriaceae bacterium]
MSLRILLADDHALVRAGIRRLIEDLPGHLVVAEASDGREAERLARQHDPDIALIDLAMPGLNGLDAIARIAASSPRTRLLALSMHTGEHYVIDALRAGAVGYIVKDAAADELAEALAAAAQGKRYVSPRVAQHLRNLRTEAADEARTLTSRQREILQLIAEGNSTRDIAERLSISIKTVESHRAQIMQRLDIHDVAGLTRYAMSVGLVPPPD